MFPESTCPAEWAKAFLDSHPEFSEVPPFALGLWFLAALRAGWDASEQGRPLDIHDTEPPEA